MSRVSQMTIPNAWASPEPIPVRQRRSYRTVFKRLVIGCLVVLLAAGGFIGWRTYVAASKLSGNKNPISLLSSFIPSNLNESNGRINVLLAGYSADDPSHQGADLTDSIMIMSVNPTTKSAVLISVPRDLYVNIPGFGYNKINAAYEDGQSENFNQSGYANGGMGLLEQVITQDLGINIDYEALLNYAAFKDAVDAVGGITVTINSSDPRGLYDPYTNLRLPNGTVTLNGQEALDLARARGDGPGSYGFPNGDFDRTEHQQQMLVALKDKAATASVFSNPLKVGALINAIGNNVQTDMTVGQMETFYSKTKGISDSNIKSVELDNINGQDLLTSYTTDGGEDALIPASGIDDYNTIQTTLANILSTNN